MWLDPQTPPAWAVAGAVGGLGSLDWCFILGFVTHLKPETILTSVYCLYSHFIRGANVRPLFHGACKSSITGISSGKICSSNVANL